MRILRQADQWARTAAWDESKERGWIRIPGGGWEHESGDARILPSQDIPGYWQLYDQTVRGPDHWAPIKQPSINPQHLMNFADWAAKRVARPPRMPGKNPILHWLEGARLTPDDEDDDYEDFADDTAWFAAGWDDEDDEIEHLAL